MHWIENALANVNIEALNDMLRWTIGLINIFELDIGVNGTSIFETTIPVADFLAPIAALGMFIVICGVSLKLYISILSPFDSAEEPGAILLRGALAAVGVRGATQLFVLAEKGFNEIYKLFVSVYQGISSQYVESLFGGQLDNEAKQHLSNYNKKIKSIGLNPVDESSLAGASGSKAFNFFGGENLIDPGSVDYGATASLGIMILELVIGCTLMICFFRLVLEVYERYVLLGVMYITSPLAFSSIVSRDSQVFKSWFNMLISQFILMCVNLVFVGGFIGAWYNIIRAGLDGGEHPGYLFPSYTAYITTMFTLIGWLLAGQKIDQHLKGIGLSTAQTGAGIMGALAGGMVVARTALGAAGSAGSGMHRAANGQTMMQRAWQMGKEGRGGGVPGAIANSIYGGREVAADQPGGKAVGNINALPRDPRSEPDGAKRSEIYESNKAAYDQIQQIAQSADVRASAGKGIARFDAAAAKYVSGGDGYAVISSNGIEATVYRDFDEGAKAHPNEVKPIDIGSKEKKGRGAIHFTPVK